MGLFEERLLKSLYESRDETRNIKCRHDTQIPNIIFQSIIYSGK